jgi:hypothetical protein
MCPPCSTARPLHPTSRSGGFEVRADRRGRAASKRLSQLSLLDINAIFALWRHVSAACRSAIFKKGMPIPTLARPREWLAKNGPKARQTWLSGDSSRGFFLKPRLASQPGGTDDPGYIGGVRPSLPTRRRAVVRLPSAPFMAPVKTLAPTLASDWLAGAKVTIGVPGFTLMVWVPPL